MQSLFRGQNYTCEIKSWKLVEHMNLYDFLNRLDVYLNLKIFILLPAKTGRWTHLEDLQLVLRSAKRDAQKVICTIQGHTASRDTRSYWSSSSSSNGSNGNGNNVSTSWMWYFEMKESFKFFLNVQRLESAKKNIWIIITAQFLWLE